MYKFQLFSLLDAVADILLISNSIQKKVPRKLMRIVIEKLAFA